MSRREGKISERTLASSWLLSAGLSHERQSPVLRSRIRSSDRFASGARTRSVVALGRNGGQENQLRGCCSEQRCTPCRAKPAYIPRRPRPNSQNDERPST